MDFLIVYSLVFVFAIGAAIGSFLNVVIYRVPEGLSVVSPPSRCPVCETRIAWYDNIPIFSWFILRGRCRSCGTDVSPRYVIIEILTALVAVTLWWQRLSPVVKSGNLSEDALIWIALPWLLYFFFACLLIVISFIDLDHFLIPHEFTVPGMVVGLASPWVLRWAFGSNFIYYTWPPITPWVSLFGFLAGGLVIVLIFYVYLAARGIEGMGGGDVTLMAMVGAWLGWPSVVFVLFAASFQGLLAAGVTTLFGVEFVKDSKDIFDDDDETEVDAEVDSSPETELASEVGDVVGDAEIEQPSSDAVQVDASEAVALEVEPVEAVDVVGDIEFEEREAGLIDGNFEELLDLGDEEFGSLEDREVEEDSEEMDGKAAIPFGPFISLAAIEYLLLGPWLPTDLSMIHFFY